MLAVGSLLIGGAARADWLAGGAPLCTATGDQFNSVVVSDGIGGAIVAWQDRRGGGSDIYAQRIGARGDVKWTADGVPVCTASGDQANVAMCTDGARGAIIAWEDYRYSAIDSDIYAVRLDSSGVVRAKWTVNGTPVCNAPYFQGNPTIVPDGAGGAVLAWEDLRSDTHYEVYALRLLADGTVATGWAANGVAVAPGGSNQYQPALAADGLAGAYAVWSDDRDTTHVSPGLFAQRITGAGAAAAGWPAGGLLVCGGGSSPMAAAVVADGAGGARVAWQDQRGATFDLYAQRLLPTGAAAWASGGVAVCTEDGDQTAPGSVADGRGGVVIAWNDTRDGAEHATIHAQRLDSLGTATWTTGGTGLFDLDDRLGAPCLSSDGADGAIVVAQAYTPDGETDVYAQRVTDAGAVPWGAASPAAVCLAPGGQQGPRAVPDGAGGAIVGWYDNRSNPALSTYDIYAQRVTADGTAPVSGVPLAPARTFRLAPPRPNPSRGPVVLAFSLPEATDVSAAIWDVAGRRVRELASNRRFEAGPGSLGWDGRDEAGSPAPPGVYLARVSAGPARAESKILRLR